MKTDAELDELTILPEIEKALFPLRPEELERLEESVLAEGIRDPLVVWPREDGTRVLVDGHQRYRLAKEHGLVFQVVEREFRDLDEVLDWIDRNQIARRNLTDEQRLLVIGRIYERQKLQRGRPSQDEKSAKSADFSPNENGMSAERLARSAGVSERTVHNAAEFARAVEAIQEVSPEAAERVLRGEVRDAITRLPKVVKEKPELVASVAMELASGEVKSVKDALNEAGRKETAKGAERVRSSPLTQRCRLVHGDMLKALELPEGSADWVITDPPYPGEHLEVFSKLAEVAAHVLKPGGLALVMSGQFHLPEVIRRLEERLEYFWTIAYLTPGGQSVQVFPRRVNTFWKPVLVFGVKGAEYAGPWFGDVARSAPNDNDKSHHKWGQSESGMHDLMRHFVQPGETVLDPCLGGGTTAVVALKLGAKFIGFDVDERAIRETELRLRALEETENGAA